MINLSVARQRNGYDCGRFVVADIVTLSNLEEELNGLYSFDVQGIQSISNILPDQLHVNGSREQYSRIILSAQEQSVPLPSDTSSCLTEYNECDYTPRFGGTETE